MNTELLDKLLKAGTPTALVAEVASELARADAAQELIEKRRTKDRERKKSVPRISEESTELTESAEIHDKGSLEVSPPSPLPKPSKSSPLNPPRKKAVELPDWMPAEEWAAFREMRKSMRSVPFTEAAERGIIAELEKLRGEGHDVAKVLTKAVTGGYRGVFGSEQTKAKRAQPAKPLTPDDARRMEHFYSERGDSKNAEEMRRRYPAAFADIAGKLARSVSVIPSS